MQAFLLLVVTLSCGVGFFIMAPIALSTGEDYWVVLTLLSMIGFVFAGGKMYDVVVNRRS